MIEVEGILEDVLAEVFRKRVCPMLEYYPSRPARLVVSTQVLRFRGGIDGGDNFFHPGDPGHCPEFTWKATDSFQSIVHQFRFDFLGNLDARALESYVLFGIYRQQDLSAETAESTRPASSTKNLSRPEPVKMPVNPMAAAAYRPREPVCDPPLHLVAEGCAQRLVALHEDYLPEDSGETENTGHLAQVIDAATPIPPTADDLDRAADEEVPDILYEPLPAAEVSTFVEEPDAPIYTPLSGEESTESVPAPEAEGAKPAAMAETPEAEVPVAWEQPAVEEATEPEEGCAPAQEKEPLAAEPARLEWNPGIRQDEEFGEALESEPAPEAEEDLQPVLYEPLRVVDPRDEAEESEEALDLPINGRPPEDMPGNLYQDYFGFEWMPFNNTPDTQFYFPTRRHQEAMARLIYAISERKGFVLVTGEIGCGKSTLCRELIARLPSDIKTAMITHTHLSATQLLRAIAEDFGLNAHGCTRYEILQLINHYLIEQLAAGQHGLHHHRRVPEPGPRHARGSAHDQQPGDGTGKTGSNHFAGPARNAPEGRAARTQAIAPTHRGAVSPGTADPLGSGDVYPAPAEDRQPDPASGIRARRDARSAPFFRRRAAPD